MILACCGLCYEYERLLSKDSNDLQLRQCVFTIALKLGLEETACNLICLPHIVPGLSGHCSHRYHTLPSVFHFGPILKIVTEIVDITLLIISQSFTKCMLDHIEGSTRYQSKSE